MRIVFLLVIVQVCGLSFFCCNFFDIVLDKWGAVRYNSFDNVK